MITINTLIDLISNVQTKYDTILDRKSFFPHGHHGSFASDCNAVYPVRIGHGQTMSAKNIHENGLLWCLQTLVKANYPNPVRLLDVGCGSGYMTVAMALVVLELYSHYIPSDQHKKSNVHIHIDAIDIVPEFVNHTKKMVKTKIPCVNHNGIKIYINVEQGNGYDGHSRARAHHHSSPYLYNYIYVGAEPNVFPVKLQRMLAHADGVMLIPMRASIAAHSRHSNDDNQSYLFCVTQKDIKQTGIAVRFVPLIHPAPYYAAVHQAVTNLYKDARQTKYISNFANMHYGNATDQLIRKLLQNKKQNKQNKQTKQTKQNRYRQHIQHTADYYVIDVGSGYGCTASHLAKRGMHVLGIEKDQTMHQYANLFHSAQMNKNDKKMSLNFVKDDWYTFTEDNWDAFTEDKMPVNAIVFLMTLLHMEEPAEALAKAARSIDKDGIVYIENFCLDGYNHLHQKAHLYMESMFGTMTPVCSLSKTSFEKALRANFTYELSDITSDCRTFVKRRYETWKGHSGLETHTIDALKRVYYKVNYMFETFPCIRVVRVIAEKKLPRTIKNTSHAVGGKVSSLKKH